MRITALFPAAPVVMPPAVKQVAVRPAGTQETLYSVLTRGSAVRDQVIPPLRVVMTDAVPPATKRSPTATHNLAEGHEMPLSQPAASGLSSRCPTGRPAPDRRCLAWSR